MTEPLNRIPELKNDVRAIILIHREIGENKLTSEIYIITDLALITRLMKVMLVDSGFTGVTISWQVHKDGRSGYMAKILIPYKYYAQALSLVQDRVVRFVEANKLGEGCQGRVKADMVENYNQIIKDFGVPKILYTS